MNTTPEFPNTSSKLIDASEAFGKSKPPSFPEFTANDLFALGVQFTESDFVRRVEVPLIAQRNLCESLKTFGFGVGQALKKQFIPHMLHVLGFDGTCDTSVDGETLTWSAWQKKDPVMEVTKLARGGVKSIIGIVGVRGSGKDTAAAALIEEGYVNVKFAGAIKTMLYAYLSYRGATPELAAEMIDGRLKEEPSPLLEGRSPRFAMQTLGTEWGRNQMDENIWVNTCLDCIKQHTLVVVTDVRFENEVQSLKRIGATIIRIERPDRVVDAHASESSILTLPVDFVIQNNSTIENLQNQIRQFSI